MQQLAGLWLLSEEKFYSVGLVHMYSVVVLSKSVKLYFSIIKLKNKSMLYYFRRLNQISEVK